MDVRFFQIVVPVISALFVIMIINRYMKAKITVYELGLGFLFWIGVFFIALFPDFISNAIARIFGIKSNTNAIIFFCLGIIFFIQFKMYFMIKKQDRAITELVRHIALSKKKQEADS